MDNGLLVKSIRNLCKKNNIAISQLENKLNFGAGLISRWTKSSPSLDKIIDIADYFNVSLDEVVGRNTQKNKSEFITTLINLTTLDAIKWTECTKQPIDPLYNDIIIFNHLTNINNKIHETFIAKYNGSSLFIVAEYNDSYSTTQNLKCSLFIQPDSESKPILQADEDCEELWLLVHATLKGESDEYKAAKVKQDIINSKDEIIFNNLPQFFENTANNNEDVDKLINDKNLENAIVKMDTSQLNKIIEVFTDPNMLQTLNKAINMVDYFTKIKEQQKQSTNPAKIEE